MSFISQFFLFLFLISMVIAVSSFITFKVKGVNVKDFIKKDNNSIKSALTAIVGLSIIAFLISLIPFNANSSSSFDGRWFDDAGVYVGLDYTNGSSPQCSEAIFEDRGTSNLGAWMNIWKSKNDIFSVDAKYTHHSCYLGKDENIYDAAGIQIEWKVWKRK